MQTDEEDTKVYRAVMNHEEQYSIWLQDEELPLGWEDAGVSGTKGECLDYISEVWIHLKPHTLRRRSEEHTASE